MPSRLKYLIYRNLPGLNLSPRKPIGPNPQPLLCAGSRILVWPSRWSKFSVSTRVEIISHTEYHHHHHSDHHLPAVNSFLLSAVNSGYPAEAPDRSALCGAMTWMMSECNYTPCSLSLGNVSERGGHKLNGLSDLCSRYRIWQIDIAIEANVRR